MSRSTRSDYACCPRIWLRIQNRMWVIRRYFISQITLYRNLPENTCLYWHQCYRQQHAFQSWVVMYIYTTLRINQKVNLIRLSLSQVVYTTFIIMYNLTGCCWHIVGQCNAGDLRNAKYLLTFCCAVYTDCMKLPSSVLWFSYNCDHSASSGVYSFNLRSFISSKLNDIGLRCIAEAWVLLPWCITLRSSPCINSRRLVYSADISLLFGFYFSLDNVY